MTEFTVTIRFERLGSKTKMNLKHVGFPAVMANGVTHGWNESLDKLAASLI